MAAAPLRFLNAAAWPLTIWPSLMQLEKHPADDYVERTSPIVATAIAFWIGVAALVVVAYLGGGLNVLPGDDGGATYTVAPRWVEGVSSMVWFFLPLIYVIGLWLFTAREEAYPR